MIITNNIVFENLKNEMAKKQLTIMDLSKLLGIKRDTLTFKLSGKKPINLDEALYIAKEIFPEHDVYYLFKELVPLNHCIFTKEQDNISKS